MIKMKVHILCRLLLAVVGVMGLYDEYPQVTTTNGDIFGERIYYSEDKYLNYSGYFNHFKGIPYAKPPVGDLRFRPPEPAEPWSESTYNATYYRNACTQRIGVGNEESLAEDCLYLNVLVPENLTDAATVLVWIHGGQYRFGTGSDLRYYGVPLVAAAGGDVVYVTMNYRLGVMGFQTTGDDVSPGNYGLMDQRMALEWIQENIKAFGGDPEKVTIFGLSSGSSSITAQILNSPESDLFQRVILQSGSVFDSSTLIELNISRAIDVNKQVASILGCETESSTLMVACMRSASVNDILEAEYEVEERYASPRSSTILFYPVIDGKFIPDTPDNLIKRGDFKKVDVILGVNEDEAGTWLSRVFEAETLSMEEPPLLNKTYFTDLLKYVYGNGNMLYIDSIKQEYTDWEYADDPYYNYIDSWVRVNSDALYHCPIDVTARVFAEAGQSVFRYVNTHIPSIYVGHRMPAPEWHGVTHFQEAAFVFGFHFNSLIDFNNTEEERIMSVKVMRYWTNFAKTGNPNTAEPNVTNVAEPWPLFTVPGLEYKELSPEMENNRAYDARECSFWANYVPKLLFYTEDLSELEEDWRNSYYDWKDELDEWQTVFDEYKAATEPCN
ncbi:cholinesterase-like [Antedon mediterranea]|uniref:cholinesterase-like n=1 Tax=Antedon mediterranea TaxID=105859 RepID=UPI003AF608A0